MMTFLYIYDYRSSFDPKDENSEVAALKIGDIKRALPDECQLIDDEKQEISYAIAHFNTDELKRLHSGSNIDQYADLQIFFCVISIPATPE